MFQAFAGGVMSRAWVLPKDGKHHSANKTKKKQRKHKRIARRANR